LTPTQRLKAIAEIIEDVDNREMVSDGPIMTTRLAMTDAEMVRIYRLAIGARKAPAAGATINKQPKGD